MDTFSADLHRSLRRQIFLPKIYILRKNQNFDQKANFFIKNRNFDEKAKCFTKNRNFDEKSTFLPKNRNFDEKSTFLTNNRYNFDYFLENISRSIFRKFPIIIFFKSPAKNNSIKITQREGLFVRSHRALFYKIKAVKSIKQELVKNGKKIPAHFNGRVRMLFLSIFLQKKSASIRFSSMIEFFYS